MYIEAEAVVSFVPVLYLKYPICNCGAAATQGMLQNGHLGGFNTMNAIDLSVPGLKKYIERFQNAVAG